PSDTRTSACAETTGTAPNASITTATVRHADMLTECHRRAPGEPAAPIAPRALNRDAGIRASRTRRKKTNVVTAIQSLAHPGDAGIPTPVGATATPSGPVATLA